MSDKEKTNSDKGIASQSHPTGIASQSYNGIASFGKIVAVIGAVITTIICIIVIIFGLITIFDKNPKQATQATITSVICYDMYEQNTHKYICSLHLNYMVNGQAYTAVLDNQKLNQLYTVGQTITIYYDPRNPDRNIQISAPLSKNSARLMIYIAVGVMLLSWGWVWLTRRYKFLAAVQGVDTGLGILRR